MSAASGLSGVLETCVYCWAEELEPTESFYSEVLGLRTVASWPGGRVYRIGSGVLLLFEREALAEREGPIARHGSTGPDHVCLLAQGRKAYERLKRRLAEAGVEITHEQEWDGGRRTFYFNDPAANLLEIAEADIWPDS